MDRSGQTLGKYKLIRRLGKGGMAEVYLAIQPTIEREVAIKVLHGHLGDEQDFILRFKREARNLGQLQHPNIMQVLDFDFDEEENVYYMVMDFIAGPTLRSYLDEKGSLSIEESLSIVVQLVEGLAYAHGKGAVHRDIKPANVMFADKRAKKAIITDFGITRMINDQTLTMEGSMVGTPAYMSPEAVLGERVDGRTDIYSIGVMLYEMVTGRTPYEGNTPLSMVVKQVHEPLPSPLDHRPDLPIPVVELIKKSLAKEVNGRFQTATEFLQAIQRVQKEMAMQIGGPTLARATVPAMPKLEDPKTVVKPRAEEPALPTAAPASTPSWLPYAGAGVLLLLLIGGFFAFSGRGDNDTAVPTATSEQIVAVDPTATEADAPTTAAPTAEAAPADPTATFEPDLPTAATDTPAPAETAVPAPTLPQVEPNRTGVFIFPTSGSTTYQLKVDRVPLADADTRYTVWLGSNGAFTLLEQADAAQNKLRVAGNIEQNFMDTFDSVLITLEPNENPTQPSDRVVFEGEFAGEIRPLLQQLYATDDGQFDQAAAQFAIANQHFGLAQNSLAAGDLDEAKRHVEHVVNILDGESGSFFGDLNLDGQAQNPGDGTGVRVYVTQIGETLTAIGAAAPQTAERQRYVELGETAVSATLTSIDNTLQRASAFTATDTVAEAEPIAAELETLMNRIINRSMGTLTFAQQLAQMPITLSDGTFTAPDPVANADDNQIGAAQLFNSIEQTANSIYIAFEQTRPADPQNVYRIWLRDSASDTVRFVDEQPLFVGQAEFFTGFDENILLSFDQLIISLEDADASTDAIQGDIVAQGNIDGSTTITLLTQDENGNKGAFFGIEEQLRLAIQHHGLAHDGLDAGDLDLAKIHAEHVVNILDGTEGDFFGDLNFDGQAQNPGDGVGVRGYWERAAQTFADLRQQDDLTGDQRFALDQLNLLVANNQATLATALDQANKILATDTVEEARPFSDSTSQQLDILLNGSDLDNNVVIDPLRGEGGILAAADLLLLLVDIRLFADGSTASKPSSLTFRTSKLSFAVPTVSLVCDLSQFTSP